MTVKISKAEVDAAGGWMWTTKEGREQGERAQKRSVFLKTFSTPKARRIAGSLYDAKPDVRSEVLKAFKKFDG